jgi:hypothetical protein
MLEVMGGDPQAIDEALAAVQRALDSLTARGQHEAAFQIAKAQFSASVRASWPGNLSAVASAIDRVLALPALALTDGERAELVHAADVLRAVPHP